MRSSYQSSPDADDNDSGTFGRAMGCPVRIPIWSRELLFLLIFLGGAGFLVVADRDSRPEGRSPSDQFARARYASGIGRLRFRRKDSHLLWLGQDGSSVGCRTRSNRHGVGKSRICEPRRIFSR